MLLTQRQYNSQQKFPVAPEGAHAATLEAITDLGIQETQYGPKAKVRLTWLLDTTSEDGRPLKAFQSFTKSWGEKSNLRKTARQILGRDPGPEYDTDDLIGKRATLVLGHDEVGDKIYANVRAILTLREGERA